MLISKFGGDDIQNKIGLFEDKNRCKLPKKLRIFLEKYNGGKTPKTKFTCNGISSDVKAFYGMGDVEYSFDNITLLEHNGTVFLPFACDSFGNELVIETGSGRIFFKDHEIDQIQQVTDSLEQFINICESDTINPSSIKSVEERETDLIKRGRGAIITDALRDMWKAEIDKYGKINQEIVSL